MDIIAFTQDILSDHRTRVHRSHEAFLEYGHQAMKTEKEALLLKLAVCQGKPSHTQKTKPRGTVWDTPPEPSCHPAAQKPSQFGYEQLSEFATGSLVKCFGDHYSIYNGRRAPRTPNGDLLLMSRILEVTGTRGDYKQKAGLVAEYDVPADAWYYRQNSAPVMPYSVYMEIALQPCGFLATYIGCTLIYPDLELRFRNLDSKATLLRDVDLRNRTITAKSELTSVAASAETVIVQFTYELSLHGVPFYRGSTSFGYFTPNALANQVGLDQGEKTLPWYKKNSVRESELHSFAVDAPEIQADYFQPKPDNPFFYQPSRQLNFLDRITISPEGGKYGLGYIYGEKTVDPDDWFFPCHFYEDPVMPGSLGVEAILQLMRMFAIHQNLGQAFRYPFFSHALSDVIWKYRGQIVPSNRRMSIEAHIKKVDVTANKLIITADANLWKDGLRIYEVIDAAVALVEGAQQVD